MGDSWFVHFSAPPRASCEEFRVRLAARYGNRMTIEAPWAGGSAASCLEWRVDPVEEGIWRASLTKDTTTVVIDGAPDPSLELVAWLAAQALPGRPPYFFDASYSFGFDVASEMTPELIEADRLAERRDPPTEL